MVRRFMYGTKILLLNVYTHILFLFISSKFQYNYFSRRLIIQCFQYTSLKHPYLILHYKIRLLNQNYNDKAL